MDIQLQNAYVEVLLDNFMSVVKQNIMFQAQLEVLKSSLNSHNELRDKCDRLEEERNQLKQQLDLINSEIVVLRNETNTRVTHEEKNRLQTAVNDYMRQVKNLKNELVESKAESQEALIKNNNHIEELNKYIQRLESVVPANKLKKIKLNEMSQEEQIIESNDNLENTTDQVLKFIVDEVKQVENDDNVKSGGSF